MPIFLPATPVPSSISAPRIYDPLLRFQTDAGYEVRRSRVSRPRRLYTLDWLGRSTEELRAIRAFVLEVRGGALTFSWTHNTAVDPVHLDATTPVIANFQTAHGLFSKQWLYLETPQPGLPLVPGFYQYDVLSPTQVTLLGTVSIGAGNCLARVHLPTASLVLAEDTWDGGTKLIGPEQTGAGRFHMSLTLKEEF